MYCVARYHLSSAQGEIKMWNWQRQVTVSASHLVKVGLLLHSNVVKV